MKRWITAALLLAVLLFLSVPALASDTGCVTDEAGILSDMELTALDDYAQQVSQRWDCGVYIRIVEDYREYAHEPYMAAYTLYHDENLGMGKDRDGVILLLSMRERDYAIFVCGQAAEYSLNEAAQIGMENAMLDDLADNFWYSGLEDLIGYCDYALERGGAGDPVRQNRTGMYLAIWGVSAVLAAVVCLVFYGQMKTARVKTQAHDFIAPEGLRLKRSGDLFTHRTVRRRKIESSKSGSSRSHSGGGGSGRSGKF